MYEKALRIARGVLLAVGISSGILFLLVLLFAILG